MSDDDEDLSRANLAPGTVIKGRWRVDGVMGVGGMASVYAATHRNGNRVAIKVLHREMSLDGAIRKRFLREGYASNAIAHPGVVRVHDDDVTDDGAVFFTMDLLDGESLEGRAKRVAYKFATTEILGVMHAVLDILAAAHEKGIVHRDIKPANIFLASDGTVKLLDFGVAQIRNAPELQSLATHAGAMLGTPAFMAPEQALGKTTLVDARTDIWAVGASMYYLLTGQAVHQASTLNEQLVFAATKTARPLTELVPSMPKPVADLVAKALAFDREARFPSARATQEAIARVPAEIAGMVTQPQPAGNQPSYSSPQSTPSIVAIASARTLHATAESVSTGGASPQIPFEKPLRKRGPVLAAAAALVAVIAVVAVVSLKGGATGGTGVVRTTSSPATIIPLPPETVPEVALPPPTSTGAPTAPPASATAHGTTVKLPPPPPSASSRITVPTPHPPPSASSNWLDQR
jgi:eukaryotic-like serine/threonine-protein kinase